MLLSSVGPWSSCIASAACQRSEPTPRNGSRRSSPLVGSYREVCPLHQNLPEEMQRRVAAGTLETTARLQRMGARARRVLGHCRTVMISPGGQKIRLGQCAKPATSSLCVLFRPHNTAQTVKSIRPLDIHVYSGIKLALLPWQERV
jgi:hypothetical protein